MRYYKNDMSDLVRFGLTTAFIVVFLGVLSYLSVVIALKEAKLIDVAKLSSAVGLATVSAPVKEPLTMYFIGDVMLDRGVEYMINKYGAGDYKFPFLNVADKLRTADVVFGNLEGPVSDKGYLAGSMYSFEMSPKAIDGLKYAGFNAMSCANNHMLDYTRAALEDTMDRLKSAGIQCVGAGTNLQDAISPKFLVGKGNKVAFLGYADFNIPAWNATGERSGLAPLTDSNLKDGIAAARSQGADIVIVSIHFGTEYQTTQNAEQVKWAHRAIDDGADLVVGHHPHVVEPNEQYTVKLGLGTAGKFLERKNVFNFGQSPLADTDARVGWIAYSLGNFVFDQSFSQETMQGELLEVSTNNGKITGVNAKKVLINNHYQPSIAD